MRLRPRELERDVGAGLVDRIDRDALAVDVDAHAERREDVGGDAHVADVGSVGDGAGLRAQHGGDHVLGDRVLRPAHLDLAHEGAVGADVPGLGRGRVHRCEATRPTRPFGRADGPRSVVEGGCRSAVPTLTCALTRTRGDRV